jgi:3-phosphoshikimate 1-carboxyvinyltransferase
MMGVNIKLQNQKKYKGEKIADLIIKSKDSLKAIKCPSSLNSAAIDEFLLIFLVAARAKGISYFKDLSELNQKESPRLIWGSKILNKMGIKNILKKDSIRIYGNPDLNLNKKISINNFLKDHRVFMTSVIAALTFGGEWSIFSKDSVNTSFPSFISKIKSLGGKID